MPDKKAIVAPIFFVLGCVVLFSGCTVDPVETDLLLPVEFSNIPGNMVLTHYHTDKIEIRVQAAPRLMEQINQENIRYPADLYTDLDIDPAGASDSIGPGHYVLPVDIRRIPMDPAIRILDITPSYLSVRLEKKVTKTFKITVPYAGEPAKGHIVLAPAPEPASVDLTGAESLVNAIQDLKTKPIDLSKVDETFKKEVPLDLENPQLYSASEPIIVVTVPVQEELVEKTVENIPIQIWNSSSKVSIEPAAVSVKIKGPFASMGNKEILDQVFAFMDLKGLTAGVYARHAYINIPVDLVMTQADPQVFTVKIE